MKKILNSKLVIVSEYQSKKHFFKRIHSELVKKVFIISEIKNAVPWTYAISDFNGEPIAGSFYEKELQKTSQKKIQGRKSNYKER